MLDLRFYGDNVLRQKCERVKDKNSPRVQKIIAEMASIMIKNNGIGISAPQVGINERIIVVDTSMYGGELIAMVNPIIKELSREMVYTMEGCLSFPDQFLEVGRSKKCLVEYLDERGRRKSKRFEGILAIAIQHEMDHLDGILFIDRVDDEDAVNAIISKYSGS